MSTDEILITTIVAVGLYFGIFIWLGIRLRRLRSQEVQWNRTRDEMVSKARTERIKAREIAADLQKKYYGLGEPYAGDYEKTGKILSDIQNTAQSILEDRGARLQVKSAALPWRIVFLLPLWRIYQEWSSWWKVTQNLKVMLSENEARFQEVTSLQKELAAKGEKTKADFIKLQNKTTRLIKAYESEARTPAQFQSQLMQLKAVEQEIAKILAENLAGQDVPVQQVAAAHPKWLAFTRVWDQLAKDLAKKQKVRKATREQIDKNKETIERIKALIALEMEAQRPTPTFQTEVKGEVAFLQNQENQRAKGVYSEEPAKEQEKRLRSLENRLTDLRNRRLTLVNYLQLSKQQIPRTEAWIDLLPAPFVVDKTSRLLDQVQQQRAAIHQLLHTSDDVEVLVRARFIDPQQLVVSRSKFDEKRKTYTSKHETLRQQVAAVNQRAMVAIRNLRGQNPNYLSRFDLQKMDAKRKSLVDRWASSEKPAQIKESEIELFIADCDQVENLVVELKSMCEQAEGISITIRADRVKAQKSLEDSRFLEMQQVMLQMSREPGSDSAGEAQDYAVKSSQLTTEFDQAGPDYAAITQEAQRLLSNMDDLWRGYQRQYKNEKGKMESVARQLANLKTDLEKYQSHEISAFRGKTLEQSTVIDSWLDLQVPTSLPALRDHVGEGQGLRKRVQDLLTNEISPEIRRYDQAKRNAEKALGDARSAIEEAEKVLRSVPWGKQWEKQPYERYVVRYGERSELSQTRHSALDQCYSLLDFAQDFFDEITDPEREYQSSAEKAIRDLVERVAQNAIKARDEADKLRQRVTDQCDEIRRESEELRKALNDGNQLARRLQDAGIQDQWYKKHQEYNDFDRQIAEKETYRKADRYLDHALVDVRYLLERMSTFDQL